MQASGCTETTGGTLGCDERPGGSTSDPAARGVRADRTSATAGMYSAENEHDACGVALVADLAGRRDHSIVRRGLTALLRLEHRGPAVPRPTPATAWGSSSRCPTGSCARSSTSTCRPPGRTRWAPRSCRPTRKAAAAVARIEELAAEEDLRVLGWRELPTNVEKADIGPSARAAMPAFRAAVRRRGGRRRRRRGTPLADIALERRTYCLRKRAEHETGTYFPSLSPRTIVYKGMLAEPQLEGVLPRPAPTSASPARWRWCTPGSRPTPSRPGRWPTPTATSRTTARSTPCAATATGWPPARRCWRRTCCPATCGACRRSSPRTPATRRPSTRCWSCCTWAGAACRTPC